MPRLRERRHQLNKPTSSFPASTGQDSCRRAVRIVDIDHELRDNLYRDALTGASDSQLRTQPVGPLENASGLSEADRLDRLCHLERRRIDAKARLSRFAGYASLSDGETELVSFG